MKAMRRAEHVARMKKQEMHNNQNQNLMKRGSLIYLSFPFDIVFLTDLSFASSSKD
jgi:hypothetical protein